MVFITNFLNALLLVGFQQLWLVHFDPRCFGAFLFPRRSAVVWVSCCCVSWSWTYETQQQESRTKAERRGNISPKQRRSKCASHSSWKPTNHCRALCFIRWRVTSRPHRLKKTSSFQSKHRGLHPKWLRRETNDNTLLLLYFTTMNNHNLFYEISWTWLCWGVAFARSSEPESEPGDVLRLVNLDPIKRNYNKTNFACNWQPHIELLTTQLNGASPFSLI